MGVYSRMNTWRSFWSNPLFSTDEEITSQEGEVLTSSPLWASWPQPSTPSTHRAGQTSMEGGWKSKHIGKDRARKVRAMMREKRERKGQQRVKIEGDQDGEKKMTGSELKQGSPASRIYCLMIWGGTDATIEIKCTINVMYLNHPRMILWPQSVEKLSSMKPVPGAKKIGDHWIKG